jgi:dUTPase
MSKLKMKTTTTGAQAPEYEGGVFKFFADLGMNKAVASGKTLLVPTGVTVTIPDGFIGIVGLSPELMLPNTGLAMAEGVRFVKGTVNLEVRVLNTSDAVRVIQHEAGLCELVLVAITEFDL